MYAMACTRSNITQAMGVLSRYVANPRRVHWDVLKRTFSYLQGTSKYSLCFHGNPIGPQHLVCILGYLDSHWAGDIDRRSTSRYVFTMNGGAMSWMKYPLQVIPYSQYQKLTILWVRHFVKRFASKLLKPLK